MLRVQNFQHKPSLELMLKWLLLKEAKVFPNDPYPYRYLALEADEDLQPEDFFQKLGLQDATNKTWPSNFHYRLAIFLWHERTHNCFKSPKILSLYAKANGEDTSRSRSYIETRLITGEAELQAEDFSGADLSEGQFNGATFINCDFSLASLQNATLNGVTFHGCNLDCVRFDKATMKNVRWEWCYNLDKLGTEPKIYESIADQAFKDWCGLKEKMPRDWNPEQLFKMYKTILVRYEDEKLQMPTDDQRIAVIERLIEKGKKVREEVLRKESPEA